MKKILFILTISLLFAGALPILLSAQHEGHQSQPPANKEAKPKAKKSTSKKDVYYCPMHPSYTSDKPGDCPICNMKLVKKEEAQVIEKEDRVSGEAGEGFYVSTEKQQLIGVKTDKVIYRPLSKIIRTVGRVAFDPELYKAQTEYIEALKTLDNLRTSGQEEVIKRAEALVEAAKLKLKLQGLDTKQIAELEETRKNDQSLLISSPDSEFSWVYATIYEYELEWVKLGQESVITAASYPGKEFKGKIVAIDPVFDAMTRSVRARIKVDHQDGLLKPDMYVDVQIASDLGVCLAVPKEAIMDSGLRKIVFVSLDVDHFKPVEIKTGAETEEFVQVLEGLKEGDAVVVSGNFLIDSESKLKSAFEDTSRQHSQ
ncbi:MAG: efflux RND transporter periplasmic adaptor subunit [Candidatus Omnitrophica bacterium]|nr:efflux RND transporter periplasmic adaptor subunit [Candidatus Omnitrophota bacterium]